MVKHVAMEGFLPLGGVEGYLMPAKRHSNADVYSLVLLWTADLESSVDLIKRSGIRETTVPHLVDHFRGLHIILTERSASYG